MKSVSSSKVGNKDGTVRWSVLPQPQPLLSYSGINVNRQANTSWSIAREMRKKIVVCRSAVLPVNKNKRMLHRRTPSS
jgi:hypothetical protein